MASTRFIDLVTNAEEITQVRGLRAFVKRLCNDIVGVMAASIEMPHLWTNDWFQTIAKVTAGTVSVTNGSATVTGTGTAFTAAMVGRKIRIEDDTAYYLIKSRSSDTAIVLGNEGGLDQPYQGDTDTTAEYSLFKDEYLLRADVDTQKRLRNSDNGYVLLSLSATEFDDRYPSPTGSGTPFVDVFLGREVKTYSTGTVSMTSGGRTITGASSPAWLSVEGLTRGSKVVINDIVFTVFTVDSDTQITTYEAATSTIASGTAYKVILDNLIVQLHSIPDTVETNYYRFQRRPAILDADGDLPDLPYAMHKTIQVGMLPTLWRHKGFMDRVLEAEGTFDKQMAQWERKYQNPINDRQNILHPYSIQRRINLARWPVGTGVPLYR